MVCTADTKDYDSAMEQFLLEQIKAGKNAYEMADELNLKNQGKWSAAKDVKMACRVERPNAVSKDTEIEGQDGQPMDVEEGHDACSDSQSLEGDLSVEWTSKDVVALIKAKGIELPPGYKLEVDASSFCKHEIVKLITQSKAGANSTSKNAEVDAVFISIKRSMKIHPEVTASMAATYKLNPSRLAHPKEATIRYLVSLLGVDIPDKPKLMEALKLRPSDTVSIIATEHDEWCTEVLKLIKWFSNEGLDHQTIADLLNSGNSNFKKHKAVFESIPVPPDYDETEWSDDTVSRFVRE
jgi:hypothetical protein